ncbi:hypothetical protein BDQ17DRAFT_1544332 [Cyathus striatus]|nr:hypothetical protein BDQ17DRAFT_1544332 [Cyathus striatus]
MTHGYGSVAAPDVSDKVLSSPAAADCLLPMDITSENVAADYNITRLVQDALINNPLTKATKAQKAGKFSSTSQSSAKSLNACIDARFISLSIPLSTFPAGSRLWGFVAPCRWPWPLFSHNRPFVSFSPPASFSSMSQDDHASGMNSVIQFPSSPYGSLFSPATSHHHRLPSHFSLFLLLLSYGSNTTVAASTTSHYNQLITSTCFAHDMPSLFSCITTTTLLLTNLPSTISPLPPPLHLDDETYPAGNYGVESTSSTHFFLPPVTMPATSVPLSKMTWIPSLPLSSSSLPPSSLHLVTPIPPATLRRPAPPPPPPPPPPPLRQDKDKDQPPNAICSFHTRHHRLPFRTV